MVLWCDFFFPAYVVFYLGIWIGSFGQMTLTVALLVTRLQTNTSVPCRFEGLTSLWCLTHSWCWSCLLNKRHKCLYLKLPLHLLPVIPLSATYFLLSAHIQTRAHSKTNRVSGETESECRCKAFLGKSPLYLEVGAHYKPKSPENIKLQTEKKKTTWKHCNLLMKKSIGQIGLTVRKATEEMGRRWMMLII